MVSITHIVCLVLTHLFLSTAIYGQAKPYPVGPMGETGISNLPNQKIGPNDLIGISVYDAPELTRTVRVSSDGFLRLPLLRNRVNAMNQLPIELEVTIADALREEGILIEPVVVVTIAEYHSRPVSVMGAVKRPLTFQASGNVSLLEALGRAEGLSLEAGPDVIVTQPDLEAPGQVRITKISVRDLIDNARMDLNLELHGGEQIRVPEAKRIYVAGNVKKPGAIPVRDGSPITILKALGMSEGLTAFHKKTIYILRPDDSGSKQEIPVELGQILNRKSEDIALQPEDILYIPDDNRKRVTTNVIEKAATFSLGTVSGFLIWRGR